MKRGREGDDQKSPVATYEVKFLAEDDQTAGVDGREEYNEPLADHELVKKEGGAESIRRVVAHRQHVGVVHRVTDAHEKVR